MSRVGFTPIYHELLLQRDGNNNCWYCGAKTKKTNDRQIDHIVADSRGGSSNLSNLRFTCKKCNRSKSAKDVEQFIAEQFVQTQRKLARLTELFNNPDLIYPEHYNENKF